MSRPLLEQRCFATGAPWGGPMQNVPGTFVAAGRRRRAGRKQAMARCLLISLSLVPLVAGCGSQSEAAHLSTTTHGQPRWGSRRAGRLVGAIQAVRACRRRHVAVRRRQAARRLRGLRQSRSSASPRASRLPCPDARCTASPRGDGRRKLEQPGGDRRPVRRGLDRLPPVQQDRELIANALDRRHLKDGAAPDTTAALRGIKRRDTTVSLIRTCVRYVAYGAALVLSVMQLVGSAGRPRSRAPPWPCCSSASPASAS